jgi:phosphoribosylanthranilate isomerase
MRTRIKICGVTRAGDAKLAASAGADAIGLVLHRGSRRGITKDRAAEIIAALPPFVTAVGLFVDQEIDELIFTIRDLGLSCAQLHGNESAEVVAALAPIPVIKAICVDKESFSETLRQWRDAISRQGLSNLRGFVLETAKTGLPGGSGIANDWETVARASKDGALEGLPPIIAAGGLNADNVASVIRRLRPWAVDVSSGVEESPGSKSARKIEAFIAAVCKADSEGETRSSGTGVSPVL